MMKVIASLVAGVWSLAVWAGVVTWQVNQTIGDDTAAAADATGKTPFATIQAAVAAAKDGDIVRVAPGVYKEPPISDANGKSRLVVAKKLTIEATGSRDDTIIEGAWDPSDASHGLGPDAVRCVDVESAATLKGFTFLNGATQSGSDSAATSGGGVFVKSGVSGVNIVDCTFDNCSSTRGGGMRRGNAFRTIFRNCYASNYGAAAREAATCFCLIEKCSGAYILAYCGNVINCTFDGNSVSKGNLVHFDKNATVCNCLIISGVTSIGSSGGKTLAWDGCACYTTLNNANDNCLQNVWYGGIFSPLFGDRNPYEGSPIAGKANAAWKTEVLAKYQDFDLEGQPVVWEDGKLSPGAYQTVKTPASGMSLFLSTSDSKLTVDGVAIGTTTNYTFDACWPTQHFVTAVYTGKDQREITRLDLYLNGGKSSDQTTRPPLTRDNTVWVTAPPTGKTACWIPYAGMCYWVDKSAEYEGEADGSPEKPYLDIQAAVTNTTSVRTIKVKAGVYDSGEGADRLGGLRNRVEYHNDGYVRFVGVDGPEKTIVVGEADPDASENEHGCGPNAMRCFATGSNCVIQDFTLTGGHSDAGAEITASNTGGAAYSNGGTPFYYHCIISNNVAKYSVVCNGGKVYRCLVTNNGYGSGVGGSSTTASVIADSLFVDNHFAGGALANKYVTAYNSTFVETEADGLLFGPDANVYFSVCYGTQQPGRAASGYGSVLDGTTTSVKSFTEADPCFHDRPGGDYHLASVSPAVGIADLSEVDYWWRYAGSDFEGNRQLFVNGTATAGAFQTALPSVRIGVSSGPSTDVSPLGVVFAEERDSLELTAGSLGQRLFEGFRVNGELVPGTGDSASWTYVFPKTAAGETVTASYATNWYVNPAMSDANSGASPDCAKKTLEKALEHTVAGDVVHLAEGDYNEGAMLQTEPVAASCTPYIRSRAVVPEGVTLVADGAREATVIWGAAATGEGADENGCGPNAIRCVFLESNTRLKGLTLRGGHTDCVNQEDDNNHGGGVLVRTTTSGVVEDCAIEDCCSLRGGGARYGTFCRCRFTGNLATRNCAAARQGRYFGCFFDRNYGQETVGYYLHVRGCTFGPNNKAADRKSNSHALGSPNGGSPHRSFDTLFCDFVTSAGASSAAIVLTNCAIYADVPLPPGSVLSGNCVQAPKDELCRLDEKGAPIAGLNPACDKGDFALWQAAMKDGYSTESNTVDADGQPRIANAAMDIGCYEADWKARYSADIGKRRCLSLSDAPALAHEESNGEVYLPSGTLAGTLTVSKDFAYAFPVRVTGNGTLTVTIGEDVKAYQGPCEPFTVGGKWTADETMNVSFAYQPGEADAGGAYFGRGGRISGLTLFLR